MYIQILASTVCPVLLRCRPHGDLLDQAPVREDNDSSLGGAEPGPGDPGAGRGQAAGGPGRELQRHDRRLAGA